MKKIILTLLFFVPLMIVTASITKNNLSKTDEKMVRDLLRIQEDAWFGEDRGCNFSLLQNEFFGKDATKDLLFGGTV